MWDVIESAAIASDISEPKTIEDVMSGANSVQWSEATKAKRDGDGKVDRLKARLVAQGYSQHEGVDYDEVFSPVASYSSIRSVLAIANELNFEIHQMDVKIAFLNGDLDTDIFMKQPDGFVDDTHPDYVNLTKVFTG